MNINHIDVLFADCRQLSGVSKDMQIRDRPFGELIESADAKGLTQTQCTVPDRQPSILQQQMHTVTLFTSHWTLSREHIPLSILKSPKLHNLLRLEFHWRAYSRLLSVSAYCRLLSQRLKVL